MLYKIKPLEWEEWNGTWCASNCHTGFSAVFHEWYNGFQLYPTTLRSITNPDDRIFNSIEDVKKVIEDAYIVYMEQFLEKIT